MKGLKQYMEERTSRRQSLSKDVAGRRVDPEAESPESEQPGLLVCDQA